MNKLANLLFLINNLGMLQMIDSGFSANLVGMISTAMMLLHARLLKKKQMKSQGFSNEFHWISLCILLFISQSLKQNHINS